MSGRAVYTYVKADPVNGVDPSGTDTLQLGFAATGHAGPFALTLGFGLAFDSTGDWAPYVYYGGGAGTGLIAKFSASAQYSNARSVKDLRDVFYNASASGVAGLGGSLDGFVSPDGKTKGAGGTVDVGAGASLFGGATNTYMPVTARDVVNFLRGSGNQSTRSQQAAASSVNAARNAGADVRARADGSIEVTRQETGSRIPVLVAVCDRDGKCKK